MGLLVLGSRLLFEIATEIAMLSPILASQDREHKHISSLRPRPFLLHGPSQKLKIVQ